MREKINATSKSRLSFALLASGLLHIFVIALPYLLLTHSVVHPKRTGSLPGRAVIKITLANVMPRIRATSDDTQLSTLNTQNLSAFVSEQVTAAVPDRTVPAVDMNTVTTATGVFQAPPPEAPLVAYYPIERLTKRPQPMTSVQLDAPAISPLIASGKVIMKLWINEWGGVNDAVVENSDLPLKFSETAIVAMKQLKFTPGEFYGRKVAVLMKIEISYDDFRKPSED